MSPIANMLNQIRNGQARGHSEVVLPFSNMKFKISEILKNKGMVKSVDKRKKKTKKSEFNMIAIELQYDNGAGKIEGARLISKPSRRIYAKREDLKPVRNGYGFSVVSTSKGLMTGDEARRAGLGGEILFEIW